MMQFFDDSSDDNDSYNDFFGHYDHRSDDDESEDEDEFEDFEDEDFKGLVDERFKNLRRAHRNHPRVKFAQLQQRGFYFGVKENNCDDYEELSDLKLIAKVLENNTSIQTLLLDLYLVPFLRHYPDYDEDFVGDCDDDCDDDSDDSKSRVDNLTIDLTGKLLSFVRSNPSLQTLMLNISVNRQNSGFRGFNDVFPFDLSSDREWSQYQDSFWEQLQNALECRTAIPANNSTRTMTTTDGGSPFVLKEIQLYFSDCVANYDSDIAERYMKRIATTLKKSPVNTVSIDGFIRIHDFVLLVTQGIQHNPYITRIVLTDVKIYRKEDFRSFFDVIANYLKLAGSRGEQDIRSFPPVIAKHPNTEGSPIESVQLVGPECSLLNSLELHCVRLSSALQELASMLEHAPPTLTHLTLNFNGLKPSDGVRIVKALKKNSFCGITHLDLSNNSIIEDSLGAASAWKMFLMTTTTLTHLEYSINGNSSDVLDPLRLVLEGLISNTSLKSFIIGNSICGSTFSHEPRQYPFGRKPAFGKFAVSALAKVLKSPCQLEHLSLHLPQLKLKHTSDWMVLVEALATNTTLKTLELHKFKIGDRTFKALAQSLTTNCTLRKLYVSDCVHITEDGMEAFIEYIPQMQGLHTFDSDECLEKLTASERFHLDLNRAGRSIFKERTPTSLALWPILVERLATKLRRWKDSLAKSLTKRNKRRKCTLDDPTALDMIYILFRENAKVLANERSSQA